MATVRGHGPTRGTRKGAIDGGKIWWVAPDYPTASEIWRDLKRATRGAWAHKDEVERRVELTTGGSISVKSAHDPDSLVAVGLDGLVMDEAARVVPAAWYGSLRPTLSDRGGWAVFISTPKGRNWFHKLYEHAGKTEGWARWQRPTSDNPLIPASELAQAKADTPTFYRQEYEALFTDLEGVEWPSEYFADHLWFDEWPARETVAARAIALDPSKGRDAKASDYQAIVWGELDYAGTLWVDATLERETATTMVERLYELWRVLTQRRGPVDAVGIESNQFQYLLASDLRRIGSERGATLPVSELHNYVPKPIRIRRCGQWLSQNHLRVKAGSPGARLLVDQLEGFGQDSKEHDDGPDALEGLIRLLTMIVTGRAASVGSGDHEGMEMVTT